MMHDDQDADRSKPKKGAVGGGIAGLLMLMLAGTARYCDDLGRLAVSQVDDVANYADDLGRISTQSDDAARVSMLPQENPGVIDEELRSAAGEVGTAVAEEALKSASDQTPEKSTEADLRQLRCKLLQPPVVLVHRLEEFRKECGLPLAFWAGPDATRRQRIEHPCGEVVQAFVQAMPSSTDPVVQSEEVFELGAAGEVIQRWRVPVDGMIEGVTGGELIILVDLAAGRPSSVHLAVDPEGGFRVVPDTYEFQRAPVPCPTSENLPRSANLGCWLLTEKSSGTEAQIAYEGPCS